METQNALVTSNKEQGIRLALQADKRKVPELLTWRDMTKEEVLKLQYGDHVHVTNNQGNRVITAKVNGKVRTWKRDPERWELPLKYGLYECSTFGPSDLYRLLVQVV